MTAYTEDGNEIFAESKVYMPIPQQFARGKVMGRGPYDKNGLIEDTGLPVGRTVSERFDIRVPDDTDDGAGESTSEGRRDIKVSVRLFYLPFGQMEASPVLWHEVVKSVPFGDDE